MTTLTDRGNISNFMYIGIAKRLSLLGESCKNFEVTLADGRILHCQNICPKLKVKLNAQDPKIKD